MCSALKECVFIYVQNICVEVCRVFSAAANWVVDSLARAWNQHQRYRPWFILESASILNSTQWSHMMTLSVMCDEAMWQMSRSRSRSYMISMRVGRILTEMMIGAKRWQMSRITPPDHPAVSPVVRCEHGLMCELTIWVCYKVCVMTEIADLEHWPQYSLQTRGIKSDFNLRVVNNIH